MSVIIKLIQPLCSCKLDESDGEIQRRKRGEINGTGEREKEEDGEKRGRRGIRI